MRHVLGAALGLALLRPVSMPAQQAPLAARLDSVVQSYHRAGRFDGVVLVGRADSVLYRAAIGHADPARGTPLAVDAVFPVCSITKQFTAAVVLRLVERGMLALDVPIVRWLPELGRDRAGELTLRQLLTHSSGLPNLDSVLPRQGPVDGFYAVDSAGFRDAREVTRRHARRTRVDSVPTFRYNNLDFIVAAAVVEAVTGQSFATVLQREVLAPLGLRQTGMLGVDRPGTLPLDGWTREGTGVSPVHGWQLANFGAAGGMYSTAEDLFRWDVALLQARLLPPATVQAFFAPDPALRFVGLGHFVYPLPGPAGPGPMLVDREGEIGAYRVDNVLVPEGRYSVIVLSHVDWSALGAPYRGEGLVFDLLAALASVP